MVKTFPQLNLVYLFDREKKRIEESCDKFEKFDFKNYNKKIVQAISNREKKFENLKNIYYYSQTADEIFITATTHMNVRNLKITQAYLKKSDLKKDLNFYILGHDEREKFETKIKKTLDQHLIETEKKNLKDISQKKARYIHEIILYSFANFPH